MNNARRQAEFRARMAEKGFVKLTLWVPLAKVEAVKRLISGSDSDLPKVTLSEPIKRTKPSQ